MKKLLLLFTFGITILPLIAYNQEVSTQKHFVGEKFGGGIIFYLDENGNHGLIAAPDDQSQSAEWGCMGYLVGASYVSDGQKNTDLIIAKCGNKNAAYLCKSLDIDGFKDWHLPSSWELNQLYHQMFKIGNLSSGVYCSSTEYSQRENKNNCWVQNFGKEGKQFYWDKKRHFFVRAIRKF
jgi:hypothetical protein